MLDIQRLLSKYRVEWKDRGPNTSRGNINISCPLCNKTTSPDHGHHLGILLSTGQFHCFRNAKHSGRSIIVIFRMLGIPKHEYDDQEIKDVEPEYVPDSRNYSAFNFFLPADEDKECLDYLAKRLFTNPIEACGKFNLKYSPEGKWAGRLIIPLTIGWTGRSLRSHIEPRYRAHTSESGFFLHSKGNSSILILEGAVDGMRAATVTSKLDVAGKCGNRLSPALLAYLRERRYLTIYNAPDKDIQFLQYQEEMKLLRSYCTSATIVRATMPEGAKDLGETTESEARQWIHQTIR